jgi:hypothetical protein
MTSVSAQFLPSLDYTINENDLLQALSSEDRESLSDNEYFEAFDRQAESHLLSTQLTAIKVA